MEIRAVLTILVSVPSKHTGRRQSIHVSILAMAGLTCACTAPQTQRVITDPDPSVKIPAIKETVASKDMTQVRQMITDLESDDPAVRFFSISGLEKLTGQTFGYQYFADEDKRALAVSKWKAWLEGWETAQKK